MKRVLAFALAVILLLSAVGCAVTDDNTTTSKDPGTTSDTGDTGATSDSGDPGATSEPTGDGTTQAPNEPTDAPSQGTEPHTHVYGEWVVTKAASCTEAGSRSRTCECGDTQTEEIPQTDHNYVNGVCTGCGKQNFAGTLQVLNNPDVDAVYWCTKDVIVYKKNDCYYMADHSGKVLTPGYNYGIQAANPDGYVVAYNATEEIIGTEEDDDNTFEVVRKTIDCYVLDKSGKVVFSTQCIQEEHLYRTTYSGEYIDSCNEGRIITYTPETAPWGLAFVLKTVHIYNLQGKHLASYDKIHSVGTMLGGELVMTAASNDGTSPSGLLVADKNGKFLRSSSEVWYGAVVCNAWPRAGFLGGYVLLADEGVYQLVSKDLSKVYRFSADYTDVTEQYGSLIVTKIDLGGSISEDYYLVDITKCATDSSGYSIPTLDAAVTKQGYSYIELPHIFGKDEPYALVGRNGKWGYLSMDGKTEKLYDDAGFFADGSGIVKDGDKIYVVDKNFNRISNALTGYESVQGKAGGVFLLKKGNNYAVAVYS